MTPDITPDVAPVVVTVSSSAGTGTGGLLVTPVGRRDILVKVITPFTIIAVRATRVFLQTLLGLLTAGTVAPALLPASDWLHLLGKCASLSVAATGICVVQNLIELLGRWDQTHPTLTS